MLKRARKTKTTKKRIVKAKTLTKKTKTLKAKKSALQVNKKAQWDTFKDLKKQVNKAWGKLKADIKKKAKPQLLVQDKNHLLLLLGECNYMAKECMRLKRKTKR